MNRRSILAAFLCAPLLSGCYQPGLVNLVWNEEVRLPDGRMVVVGMVHSYNCFDYRFKQFGGLCDPLDTTLTLNGGEGVGVVTQLFKGFQPMFLGEKDGIWYAILVWGYRFKNHEIPGQDWGDSQGPYGQLVIRLINGQWQPMPLADFPAEFQRPNMLLLYGTSEELAEFHQGHVTLQKKADWVVKHPPGYADVRITWPKPKETVGGASGRTTVTEQIAHNSVYSFEFELKQQLNVATGIAAKYFIDECCSIHAPRCKNDVNDSLWSRIA